MPISLANTGSLLIIIAVICLTIGYVFGWMISSIQHGKEDKKDADVEKNGASPAAAETAEEIKPVSVAASDLGAGLLRLRQGVNADELLVDISGKTWSDASSLSMGDRAEIESALRKTAQWMGLTYQLGEPAPAPIVPAQAAAAAPVVKMAEANEAPRQASVIAGVTNAIADALQPVVKKDAPLSIVQQIDEIFQAMMAGTPYETQKIYLVEDPKKGVIVRVGNDIYEGVNAVPEGEIKKMLRTAVAEWERRQELNRRRQAV